MEYLKNDALVTIRSGWPGNPFKNGEFSYLTEPFDPSWRKLLRWQLTPNPQKEQKKKDDWRPPVHEENGYLNSSDNFLVWLGHATFLIQVGNIRMITDPVLYDLPFIPRFVGPSFPVEKITDVDYLLLSHDHRDHCDRKTVRQLLRSNKPRKILTSLRMSQVIGDWVNGTPVEEAAWHQVYQTHKEIEIIYLPARHWCRRGLFDFNRRLWGSFLIRSGSTTIYFGADSGYGDHFREIGEQFPGIDIAIIGIGAYRPDYMMQEIHTSPDEAFQAFRDLNARMMVPMHYGTYDLSDEPISEPYYRIRSLFHESGRKEQLLLPKVGEPVWLKRISA